eukprot:scaffold108613_cov60-Phaeocystis_antarctica.AAC.2
MSAPQQTISYRSLQTGCKQNTNRTRQQLSSGIRSLPAVDGRALSLPSYHPSQQSTAEYEAPHRSLISHRLPKKPAASTPPG